MQIHSNDSVLSLKILDFCLNAFQRMLRASSGSLCASFSFSFSLSGITSGSHLSPSNAVFCIFFYNTHYLHVLFHSIHKSPLWSSSRPPPLQFQPQHHSTNILTIPPLYMSKPSQSGPQLMLST
ncbi:hypothetical protein XENORESO_000558 [Xenotaenia resolanae]|uniref:Uncharacterized protein n=1 Tax=Xenotaenia resolanae TaxID=208358 RepID=A0ABV0W4H3_9TELE